MDAEDRAERGDEGDERTRPPAAAHTTAAPATAAAPPSAAATHGRFAKHLAARDQALLKTKRGPRVAAAVEAAMQAPPPAPEEVLARTKRAVCTAYHELEEMAAQVAKSEHARAVEREQHALQRQQLAEQLACCEQQLAARSQQLAAAERRMAEQLACCEQQLAARSQQLAAAERRIAEDARRAQATAKEIAQRHHGLFQMGNALEAELAATWASEAHAAQHAALQQEALVRVQHVLHNETRKQQEATAEHLRRVLEARKKLQAAQDAARPPHLARAAAWHDQLRDETTAWRQHPSLHGDPALTEPHVATAEAQALLARRQQQQQRGASAAGCSAQANRAPW